MMSRKLFIIWNDQAEWYIVCPSCYDKERDKQWGGSTEVKNWEDYRNKVYEYLKECENNPNFKCELCDDKEVENKMSKM